MLEVDDSIYVISVKSGAILFQSENCFMWRKHLIGICLATLAFWGSIFVFPYKPLISDKELRENFYRHQSNFEKIVSMVSEDSEVMSVDETYVLLNGYKSWQGDTDEVFSTKRWNEYKVLFNQLGSPYVHSISKKDNVIDISSGSIAVSDIDEYESIVISKGYACSLNEPSTQVESLDELGFEGNGIYYKKIGGHWYLYFDWGISKPE